MYIYIDQLSVYIWEKCAQKYFIDKVCRSFEKNSPLICETDLEARLPIHTILWADSHTDSPVIQSQLFSCAFFIDLLPHGRTDAFGWIYSQSPFLLLSPPSCTLRPGLRLLPLSFRYFWNFFTTQGSEQYHTVYLVKSLTWEKNEDLFLESGSLQAMDFKS